MKRQRSSSPMAQITDMKKPAGWNFEPGAGFEIRPPKKPPIREPRMPIHTVAMKPILSLPGSRARAIRPTTKAVRTKKIDLVVNLAAGLDARPWRLPLPPALHWVDVDLPGILHYKTETLKDEVPVCRYEVVAADMTDAAVRRELFARLGAGATNALVVTEGLLVYLEAEQVAALATDLHAQPSFKEWLLDR